MVLVLHRVLVILLFFMLNATGHSYAEDNVITIDLKKETGKVNKKIFGNNIPGYTISNYIHTHYGAGIWDPESGRNVAEVVGLAKSAGISVVRFTTTNIEYDWKKSIGKSREHNSYGIDEFMKTMEELGAEPVLIINYFSSNPGDAADLVEYLNAGCDDGHPWACRRAANGHAEPYGVRYFEFGNEVFVYWSKRHDFKVTTEEYASRYMSFQGAMKQVDSTVQLGLNLHHHNQQWDREVLELVADKVDFVTKHIYPPKDLPYWNSTDHLKRNDIYKMILGSLVVQTENQFAEDLNLIYQTTGRKDVSFAITEYNIGLHHSQPPYRHSLGAALVNADLLRIFLKPENKVLMANYWHLANSHWGMIRAEENFMKHDYSKPVNYIKRPSYYVFELYNKHFGDIMLDVDVESGFYDMSEYKKYMKALLREKRNEAGLEGIIYKAIDKYVPFIAAPDQKENNNMVDIAFIDEKWRINQYTGVEIEEENGMLKLELTDIEKNSTIKAVRRLNVLPDSYYRLTGFIRSEMGEENKVFLEIAGDDKRSVAKSVFRQDKSVENGSWKYVEILYKTGPAAESADVIIGVRGSKEILSGKIFAKDVKVTRNVLPDTIVPYLSVNASRNKKGNKIYLMVINKNLNDAIPALIYLKNFSYSNTADAWILNGPSIDATNEGITDNVKVVHKRFDIANDSFEFTFEPHSLTAIEVMAGSDL